MQELRDSSDRAGDPNALRDEIAAHGYVLLRNVLDADVVATVRAEILDAIAAHGWLDPRFERADAVPADTRVEGGPEWWDGYLAVQHLESFHRLAHDQRLLAQLAAIIGEDLVVHPRKLARVWPCDPAITTQPHQDFPHVAGTVDFFTCWIPLGDYPVSAGGLRVLAGSHQDGVRSLEPCDGGVRIRDVAEDDVRWATTDYRIGDVLIFHSWTVHAGMPNTSGALRLSVDYRYQGVSGLITQWSLLPDFYRDRPRLPSWDELTVDWSTRRWVEVPSSVQVARGLPFTLPSLGRRGPRSDLVDSDSFRELYSSWHEQRLDPRGADE
jgi:ectoine hydroxylase-related dioxygenase (phytanoyl-CoA dioxygenase family)